jgi:hypothetical protein
MFSVLSDIPKDVKIQRQLTTIHVNEWWQDDIFHFRWWFLLALIIVLLLVWWMMLDKSRLHEICLYAVLAAIIFMGLNEYGEELTLWDYPTDIIAIFPPLSSINVISLPLIYSIVYQHFKINKKFILATVITSAIICFIFEPILSWGGFYQLLKWQYYFSFLIYVVISISIRAITIKINAITEKWKGMQSKNSS